MKSNLTVIVAVLSTILLSSCETVSQKVMSKSSASDSKTRSSASASTD